MQQLGKALTVSCDCELFWWDFLTWLIYFVKIFTWIFLVTAGRANLAVLHLV